MKHICAVIYICAVKCNAKTKKKIQISEALPSVMTKTLGKANTICRVLSPRNSAKSYFLKKPNTVWKMFAECLKVPHSAYVYHLPKRIFKKTKYCLKKLCRVSYSATLGICLSFAECNTRRKEFFKKPNIVWKIFAECLTVPHSAYVYHLPSAILGEKGILKTKKYFLKKFAECIAVWHSAKLLLTAGLTLWLFLFAES